MKIRFHALFNVYRTEQIAQNNCKQDHHMGKTGTAQNVDIDYSFIKHQAFHCQTSCLAALCHLFMEQSVRMFTDRFVLFTEEKEKSGDTTSRHLIHF